MGEQRSTCSVECGNGTIQKGRYLKPSSSLPTQVNAAMRLPVSSVGICDGEQMKTERCIKPDCNDSPRMCLPRNCLWHTWSAWGAADCTGLCTRHRGMKQSNN